MNKDRYKFGVKNETRKNTLVKMGRQTPKNKKKLSYNSNLGGQ